MEITTKGRYALRTMVDIAKNNGKTVSIAEISKRQDISEKYLEKVISLLLKANILQSNRGKMGGYALTRKPSDYTLFEILEATGDKTALVACLDNSPCPRSNNCDTKSVWNYLNSSLSVLLSHITLQDIIDKNFPTLTLTKNYD